MPFRVGPTRPGGQAAFGKRAGRPCGETKEQKKIAPIVGAGSARGAARAVSDRAIVRASPPPDFGGRETRGAARVTRARVRLLNGRARRRCWRARCVPLCCVLCHAGASYLFAVTPPWRASALPAARPRVASANAAIPRLRADLDAIATGGRARTATEARRAMRVPLGVQEKYLCREARGLKSLVGLWTVWNSRLETGDGVERALPARFSDAKSDRAAGRARQKTILRALDTATRFARARVHRSPWRRASRHSRKVRRESRRSPLSANGRLPPRPRLPRLVRAPSPSRLPRDTA